MTRQQRMFYRYLLAGTLGYAAVAILSAFGVRPF